jgi:hypothetical protein
MVATGLASKLAQNLWQPMTTFGGIVIFDRVLNSTSILFRNLLKGRRTEAGGITPDGQWIFFATPMGVDPRDVNGRHDIYRCRRDGTGCEIVTANPAGFSYVPPAAAPVAATVPIAAPTQSSSSPSSGNAPAAANAPTGLTSPPSAAPKSTSLTPQGSSPTSNASNMILSAVYIVFALAAIALL